MREILFRGKRKDTSEWTEGLTVFKLDKYVYMCKSSMCEITYDLQYNIKAITSKKPFFVEVIPETVGQYTGLTDKNGKKIFEGDIVRASKLIDSKEFITKFYISDIRMTSIFGWSSFDKFEVIGNIHDNPELLGGEENEVD